MAATGQRIREAATVERGMVKKEDAREKEKLVQVSMNCYVAKYINPHSVSIFSCEIDTRK